MTRLGFMAVALATLPMTTVLARPAPQTPPLDGDVVVIPSGTRRLTGVLFRPNAQVPWPAIVFHHGGGGCGPGTSATASILGRRFVEHGYAFLYVYRRGVGASASEGDCASAEIARVRTEKGDVAAMAVQLRRLTTDELDDARAGLAALRALPGIDTTRIVVAGASRGGQLAMLSAERDNRIRAVLNYVGGAAAWTDPRISRSAWSTRSPRSMCRCIWGTRKTTIPSPAGCWAPNSSGLEKRTNW